MIFVDTGVKIRGAYYREVLLAQKLGLLPNAVLRESSGGFFVFKQGGTQMLTIARDNQPSETREICVYLIRPLPQRPRPEPS